MKYSSLAVHCTSLCCDILQTEDFVFLTHDEINWLYDEVYELIQERMELWPDTYPKEHEFIKSVALGILKALHICKDNHKSGSPTWLLWAMQSRISSTYKRLCYLNQREL
ncbi:hypothetical protein VHA01S_021_00400 [Vibrio halioticoli NBRC 102217]|uniref:Uncharacterized protein n=1 Tax=Vibrio halioticoli NBRC 102217 TaxID=1219072 RepID=V5FI85_9VIBR|nr:hypothetical protein VHA01S_021_00400 [Vibrio halioticoli NBRC 102217]